MEVNQRIDQARMRYGFNESEHPRSEGKFASKSDESEFSKKTANQKSYHAMRASKKIGNASAVGHSEDAIEHAEAGRHGEAVESHRAAGLFHGHAALNEKYGSVMHQLHQRAEKFHHSAASAHESEIDKT